MGGKLGKQHTYVVSGQVRARAPFPASFIIWIFLRFGGPVCFISYLTDTPVSREHGRRLERRGGEAGEGSGEGALQVETQVV